MINQGGGGTYDGAGSSHYASAVGAGPTGVANIEDDRLSAEDDRSSVQNTQEYLARSVEKYFLSLYPKFLFACLGCNNYHVHTIIIGNIFHYITCEKFVKWLENIFRGYNF